MRLLLVALLCGALFGVGLVVSDMINPGRVLAFLDVSGNWDYALALVMGAALLPSALAYALRRRMQVPLCDIAFHVPLGRRIDLPLVGGAVLFGIGWGMAGFCPGPALAGLVTGMPKVLVFVAAMLGGMLLHRVTVGRSAS